MKLFQLTVLRRFGSYVKVSRSNVFKTVTKKMVDKNLSLSKALEVKIKAGGPVTVADYMRTCLTNPSLGYYMQKDIIGKKGDFITSPEISQLFGEIIALWIYLGLKKIGEPNSWQIIELGPGRGSLMNDILRILSRFKVCKNLSIHLVEVSPQLSSVQAHNLCSDTISVGIVPQRSKENPFYKFATSIENVPVYWYEKLEQIPKAFSVILAHEFFDSLPIHKFQKIGDEWREVLIDCVASENGESKFVYTISPKQTAMSKLLIKKNETREHLEVSAEAGALARHIAERLEEYGGFSLFIDYGHNGEKTDTLRAFKNHQLHDPLINPGTADLTADVDFSFLKEVMKDKMLIYGPVEQGDFLNRLGIKARLDSLLKNLPEELAKNLTLGYKMITDKDKMGSRYKCFAAFPLVLEDHFKKFPVEGF